MLLLQVKTRGGKAERVWEGSAIDGGRRAATVREAAAVWEAVAVGG